MMKAIVDCNSFYCSCERLFRPDLWHRPVVVLSNNDGCIVSRTDEAKKIGIGMAGPYYEARSLIEKNGVSVFSSNYHLYGDLSYRVMESLRMQVGAEKVEVYSVDEAFLDLDMIAPEQLYAAATEIKETTEMWTGIKVSIGVAPTKVLAKLANRMSKKNKAATNGVVVLDSEEKIEAALKQCPIEHIWGVGYRSAAKLHQWNIDTAWQLKQMSEDWARKHLGGVTGVRLIRELNGNPCISMKEPLEIKKMIATTRMFGTPVYTLAELKEAVATYTSRAAEKLRRQYSAAKQVQVFVVSNEHQQGDYQYKPKTQYTHTSLPKASSATGELIRHAVPLVEELYKPGVKYIKAGIMLGGIVPDDAIQGNLFNGNDPQLQKQLMQAVDNINFSMRDDAIKYAASGLARNWKMRQELRSKRYTTRWDELYEIS
jgi:DNA polymerase V